MGVFTTQTLLASLGVSRNRSAPGAVAINWILKVCMGYVNFFSFSFDNLFQWQIHQLSGERITVRCGHKH